MCFQLGLLGVSVLARNKRATFFNMISVGTVKCDSILSEVLRQSNDCTFLKAWLALSRREVDPLSATFWAMKVMMV